MTPLAAWRDRMRIGGRVAAGLVDRLLPPACAACGGPVPIGPPLCGLCESLLPSVPFPRCARCGAPDTSARLAAGCPVCDAWPEPLAAAASAVLHVSPADVLVAGLKYRGWTALAPRLAAHMVEPAWRLVRGMDGIGAGERGPVLAPVPLDRRRFRHRGYNQARLLADGISGATGWPVLAGGLRREPSRRRQAELGRAERLSNVRATFRWDAVVRAPRRPVLLVDDVLTTGATAAACWAAVEAGGGRCLGVVTFARSLPGPEDA